MKVVNIGFEHVSHEIATAGVTIVGQQLKGWKGRVAVTIEIPSNLPADKAAAKVSEARPIPVQGVHVPVCARLPVDKHVRGDAYLGEACMEAISSNRGPP